MAYAERRANTDMSKLTLAHLPSVREWVYWREVENEYPYDRVFKRHHLLMPKRVIPYLWRCTIPELWELVAIYLETSGEFNFWMLSARSISVPSIVHIHLGETFDKDEDYCKS